MTETCQVSLIVRPVSVTDAARLLCEIAYQTGCDAAMPYGGRLMVAGPFDNADEVMERYNQPLGSARAASDD